MAHRREATSPGPLANDADAPITSNGRVMKTLIVDNYDSFTYNLYQLVGTINGEPPLVIRNDALTWEEFVELGADNVILSPGPGHPANERDFGICRRILLEASVPVLGVCLGHQGMAHVFGGDVVRAPEPVHGRPSAIRHDGTGIFARIPQDFQAVRYHSLIVSSPAPDCLRVTAWSETGLIMAVQHRTRPLFGVQFHPESISTEYGELLLRNFLRVPADSSRRPIAVKSPSPKKIAERWKVFSRRLNTCPPAEDLFCSLYGSENPAFWLDSNDPDNERSRFSFMGDGRMMDADAELGFLHTHLLQRYCKAPDLPFDFIGGLVGYLGYELKAQCGGQSAHRSPNADSLQMFVDRFLAIDHRERKTYLVYAGEPSDENRAHNWLDATEERLRSGIASRPRTKRTKDAMRFHLEQERDLYVASVLECQRLIKDGESYEICLTNRLTAATGVDPLEYYRVLRRLNAAPYSAFLRFPDVSVACSSPELFLKVDRERNVESRPIKGTLRRSADPLQDRVLADSLRTSMKNRSENLMIVDLLRNDLGRVCEIGSVHVPKMMEVETYTNLHQLVSTVRGRLRDGVSLMDCIRSAFPGGSMTGAPKIRTMELIDHLELSARGIYSGAIGFLSLNGTAELNIVIRTAVFAKREVTIGVGGAVVALSDPEDEFEEAMLKGRALIDAFRPLVGRVDQ